MFFQAFYNWLMAPFESIALFLADMLNQIVLYLASIHPNEAVLHAVGTALGILQLIYDASNLFPPVFQYTLKALIASVFASIIIRTLITIWRVIPFTG